MGVGVGRVHSQKIAQRGLGLVAAPAGQQPVGQPAQRLANPLGLALGAVEGHALAQQALVVGRQRLDLGQQAVDDFGVGLLLGDVEKNEQIRQRLSAGVRVPVEVDQHAQSALVARLGADQIRQHRLAAVGRAGLGQQVGQREHRLDRLLAASELGAERHRPLVSRDVAGIESQDLVQARPAGLDLPLPDVGVGEDEQLGDGAVRGALLLVEFDQLAVDVRVVVAKHQHPAHVRLGGRQVRRLAGALDQDLQLRDALVDPLLADQRLGQHLAGVGVGPGPDPGSRGTASRRRPRPRPAARASRRTRSCARPRRCGPARRRGPSGGGWLPRCPGRVGSLRPARPRRRRAGRPRRRRRRSRTSCGSRWAACPDAGRGLSA